VIRTAAISSGLIAASLLAGCAARAPESRPSPPLVEYFPADVPIPPAGLPVPTAALDTQPVPVDVFVPGSEYAPDALAAWAKRARAWASGGAPDDLPRVDTDKGPKAMPRDVFLYFIHEGKVRAPAAAMGLIERLQA